MMDSYGILFISSEGAVRAPLAGAILAAASAVRWRIRVACGGGEVAVHPLVPEAAKAAGAVVPETVVPDCAAVLAAEPGFDFIFILAEPGEGVTLPELPTAAAVASWPIPLPDLSSGGTAEHSARLAEIIRMIRRRVELLAELPDAGLDRLARQRVADASRA